MSDKEPRLRLKGFRWYSSQATSQLRRRPTDVVLLVGSLLLGLLLLPAAPGPSALGQSLATQLDSLPEWVTWIYSFGYGLATIWAFVVLVVPLVRRHRWRLSAWLLLAAVLAYGLSVGAGAIAGADPSATWAALWTVPASEVFPAVRVAVVTAIIAAASPHLSHPLRQVGRVLVAVAVVCAVGVGAAYIVGTVVGLLIGIVAACIVHLIVGSPGGRPSPGRVAAALADLGLDDAEVADLPDATADGSAFSATVPDQPPLLVTVLGRDERDAQALASTWTAATRRGERLHLTTTRLARVEHAAMMSLLAERAGVRVPRLVTAGRSREGDAVLVCRAPIGTPIVQLPADQISDDHLDDAWRQLLALHAAGIAHGRIDGSRIVLDDQVGVTLTDLSQADAAPDPRDLMVDRARCAVALALATDPDRAVSSANRMLGTDGLAQLLPYLQPAVLDVDVRRRVSDGTWSLNELRERATTSAGVEEVPLEQLRRVSGKTIAQAAVLVIVTFGLITAFSGIDFAQVWDELTSANPVLLLTGLIVSLLAPMLFAFSTMGATTARLRYLPVMMLQYALQFIALALPATAARIAMDVRFFQSFGVSAGAAVSIGMIDSFSGFLVQCALLLIILLSGLPGFTQPLGSPSSTDSSTSSTSSSEPSLIVLTLAIGILSLLVVLVVPRLRRRFAERIRGGWTAFIEQAHNAKGALVVVRSPGKVLMMLGGNLGAQVVQAIVLGICLAAFGESGTLSQLILINTAVSLFAGLMPVPGGIGVAEAGYTAGLTAIGVPSDIALSTAIAFRLVTFYLPPLWGSFAMKWLRTRSYV